MRYILKIERYLLLIFLLGFFSLSGQELPEPMSPPRLVNDFANLIPEAQERSIEAKLVAFDDTSSTQIAVVLVPTIGEWAISEFAFELGDKWGVGQDGKDNGIVLLVAEKERKTFIATGSGSEGAVPDILAKRIVDYDLLPNFRNGDFGRGIDEGTTSLIQLLSGEYKQDSYEPKGDGGLGVTLFIIFIVFIIFLIIAKSNDSNGGKGQINRSGWDNVLSTILYEASRSSGSSRSSGGWSSGGWSSGRGGFGGSSGGSFGGFGGGGFSGGGAGGGW